MKYFVDIPVEADSRPVPMRPFAYSFTVFTASFNRAHTLPRVYESLKSQTYRDFEWLIVDDGSVDPTRQLVESWVAQSEIPIRYIYQENQGKHIAVNRGMKEARGELFVPLDSDDSCTPEALERFKHHWDQIPDKNQFSTVTCQCKDPEGRIVGDLYPQDVCDSDYLEMRYRYHVKGEKWCSIRTEALRQFPYPAVPNTYVSEGVVWSAMAKKYKTRFVNEALRIYEPAVSGLGRPANPARFAVGYSIWHRTILGTELGWFRHDPMWFLRSAAHYSRFSLDCGTPLGAQFQSLPPGFARFLWLLALPIGILAHLRDRYRN